MNILTFDIEEWYIYELYPKGGKDFYLPIINSILENLLDILDQNSIKSTFFCLGIIARNYPKIIRNIYLRGHEIGCHSDIHTNLINHNVNTFKKETKIAIDSLEQVTGQKIKIYRAPAFSLTKISKWALEILTELGIEIDSSVFPAYRLFGGMPEFKANTPVIIETPSGLIKEFPINYFSLIGKRIIYTGGGYFRLFPYKVIEQLMRRSEYNLSYFHIRDFDFKQKRVCSLRYFKSYYGINGALEKFQKLIKNFKYVSIREANEIINWNNVNVINL
ncbi:MAG: polysaccharide deacetylase family protein [Bacteroidales bacterium]|nr:polysaccharide deacetylase family protein [Bacteroidales bacterium]